MRCDADRALVRRDPGIPGLEMVLDPDSFAATLRILYPQAGVTAAEPLYVRYKPTTSCLVGYSVSCTVGTVSVYARAHDRSGAKIENAGRHDSAQVNCDTRDDDHPGRLIVDQRLDVSIERP